MNTDFTVGAEEEYQLVDPGSGELSAQARDVLDLDWSREMTPEVQQTQLEIGTHICASAGELRAEIRRLRLQAASVAAARELSIVSAGVHPFNRWDAHCVTGGERYERLLERYGRILRTEHVFGMHVHVAIPPGVSRIAICNVVRAYGAHIIALAASSPIYQGDDTGFHSYRSILVSRLPLSGPTPRFASEAEYRGVIDLLLRTGVALDEWTIYWSVRPHPEYPTLEFRTADACPRIEDAVGIAALCRALVAAAAEGALEEPRTPLPESLAGQAARTNEWMAARYGLDAPLITGDGGGEARPLRDDVRRVLDRIAPVAERLGDAEALSGVERILSRGSAARRIREVARETGSLPELVRWLSGESLLGTGMDRRLEQRPVPD